MQNTRSGTGLAWLACAAGFALTFVPASAVEPARGLVRDALRPGQTLVRIGLEQGRDLLAAAKSWTQRGLAGTRDSAAGIAESPVADDLDRRRLELQIAALQEELRVARSTGGATAAVESRAPLLAPTLVEARVLGEETGNLWRSRKILGIGTKDGVVESALVLDDPRPLVDQGLDARLSAGDAVYAGRIVVGKIAEVGRYSSTIRLVTDPAYSGRARLARRTNGGLVFAAEGTLVGDGGALCRLTHITEPVNIGDEVYTGGTDGLLPWPMYYGRVVDAELAPNAREWTIRVQPAASGQRIERVEILRWGINADRILAN